MVSESKSRVDDAYRRIRTDILSGRHAPGSKLVSSLLCEQYDISAGVLREVLPRLAGEGLAVAEPQRGYRVTPVSEDDLRQLTEARTMIESAVLRQSMANGGVKFEADLIAAHHTLMRTTAIDEAGSVLDEWLAVHRDFHQALLAASPNKRLKSLANSLRDGYEVYRCWSGQLGDEPSRDIDAEHTRILNAVLSNDVELAVSELVEHINHSMLVLLRSRGMDVKSGAA
jgi:DNA-binding GntR family transcriptional regulator